jgi:AAA domain
MILAPSSASAEVLRAQGFALANTLQQFAVNPELKQAVKGKVLWVNEAGFLSVRQTLELQVFAVEHNCRLVLTGDTKQHHSVERGDALRILERSGVSGRRRSPRSMVSGFPSYVVGGGSRLYKTQMPRNLFDSNNTYILCSFRNAALSFSWLAQHGWTSQEHGIIF